MVPADIAGLSSAEEEDFVRAYADLFSRAYRVAYRLLGQREAAEDTAAEALGRAFARWARVSVLPYRDAWVLRVTTNLALNNLKRRRPELHPARPVETDDAAATRVALVEALSGLPRRQREVIVLRHLGGVPEADIAKALKIGEGTVKTHTRRALASLRQRLGEDFRESSIG